MTESGWRYAYAVVTGAAHRRNKTMCQDAGGCHVLYRDDRSPVLVATASDGAGSGARSDIGSRRAYEGFVERIAALIASGGCAIDVTRPFVIDWLRSFRMELEALALDEGRPLRDFACTLLAAVIDDSGAAFCQVGDGAIVISPPAEPDEYAWVFWPQHGEYANQTHFASEPGAEHYLDHVMRPSERGTIDEIVLFTDGIERMVLDMKAQVVHAPFFRAMPAPLRRRPAEFSLSYSDHLALFLSGPAVTSRSDDDKTLVVATRRASGT